MQLEPSIIAYGAAAGAVAAFVLGIYFLFAGLRSSEARIIDRRLTDLSKARRERIAQLRRKSLSSGKSPWLAALLETASLQTFDKLVSTSGIRTPTDRILFFIVIGTAVIFECLDVIGGYNLLVCAMGALLVGVVIPFCWIVRTRNRRLARITAQLPDAIDMLVRSLRAGHPVAAGVGLVARETEPPIGTEFAIVYDEMSYGMELRQAFEKMSRRLGIFELDYMLAAIRIQNTTGGNLAEILAALSGVMREKVKLKAKVKALSAEARFSGIVLAGLPIFVVLVLLLVNPHYYDSAQTSGSLRGVLIGAAVLVLLGIYLVRRIVNIRI